VTRETVQFDAECRDGDTADSLAADIATSLMEGGYYAQVGPVRVSIDPDSCHEPTPTVENHASPTGANRLLCSHCLKEVGGELSALCLFHGRRVCEGCGTLIASGVTQHGYVVLSDAALKLLGEIDDSERDMATAGDYRDREWCDRLDSELDTARANLRKEMLK
jgi:hypothetical protein